MAFVKYTTEKNVVKTEPDVRMSASSIVITESGLAKYSELAGASYLHLHFDADAREIGVSAATQKDGDAFKFSQRGRGKSKVVSATKFLHQFGLSGEPNLTTDGVLTQENEMLTFKLGTGKPKARRGRRPKNATPSE